MKIECPICKGEGVAVKHNGVHPQKQQELYECWLCHGVGKVEEHPTEKMQIRKYWNVELADSI